MNSSTTLKGTVSAVGSWTLVLSDGTVGTGRGTSFSIPVSPVTSTTYTIQSLIDQRGLAPTNNLISKATVAVTSLPMVSLTSNGTLTCEPSSATLTATGTGSSYTFTQGNTILLGDPASNIRAISSPGAYTVRVSGVGSCTNSANVTVDQVIDPPVLGISTPNGTQLSCSQPSVQILAFESPGIANSITSYTYTYGNTLLPGDPYNRSQFVTIPGVYTVRVTGANSCTNAANVTITQLPQTPPTVSLVNNGPITCASPSVTLTATGTGTSYVFTGGGTALAGPPSSNTRVVSSPGIYTVVVTGANNCTNMATTTVGSTVATINVTNPVTTSLVVNQAVSQTFTASGGATPYSFSVASGSLPPGLSLLTSGQLSGSPTQAGSFTVVVQARDANGCTGLGLSYVVNVTPVSDLTPVLYVRPLVAYPNTPIAVVVDVLELKGGTTNGKISVQVTKDPMLSLQLNSSATLVGNRGVQNAQWSLIDDLNSTFYVLITDAVIGGSQKLSFGLEGRLNPSGTSGTITVSAMIVGGSGGEQKTTNNMAASKLDYFATVAP